MNGMSIPAVLNERVVHGRVLTNIALILGASAIIAIAAQIAIPLPFTPVPLTLQPIAVILVGAVLGSTRGAAAAAPWIVCPWSRRAMRNIAITIRLLRR